MTTFPILLLFLVAGSRGTRTQAARLPDCDSLPPPTLTHASLLAGKWGMTVVVDSGPAAIQTLFALVRLLPTDSAQRLGVSRIDGRPTHDSRFRFYGALEGNFAQLGSLPLGDLTSLSRSAPGVRVYVRHHSASGEFADIELVLREARDLAPGEVILDGHHTSLHVVRANGNLLGGTWSSSYGENAVRARGRFCGRRAD